MAGNSFLLKGWSITLISALFALAAKDTNPFFVYLAYFPCVAFWSLDGFFLWQEKMYRKLYEKVAITEPQSIDFGMNASAFKESVGSWFSVGFSVTLSMFHGTIFGVIILVMLIVSCIGST